MSITRPLVVVLCCALCGCGASPAQKEKREKARAARVAKTQTDQTPEKQNERVALIQKLTDTGYFIKVEKPAKYPKVWVTEAFKNLPYKDKNSAIGVVYAYHLDPAEEFFMVHVIDGISGNEIGNYSAQNNGLKMN